ncbi:uncharacterized protein [Antedon mediterranea]|uniref:uncharacterized protein n=1 Tax=Antedon mediterranea TaxID=105859 RepID=UPI003AF98986
MPLEKKRQRNISGSSDVLTSPSNSRAEKSRYAAKMRRDKEGVEIAALSKLLPFPEEITSKLDKGSIIRLATSYLRIKKFSQKEGNALLDELKTKSETRAITAQGEDNDSERLLKSLSGNEEGGALMLEALNGFVIFISRKGRILFVSESVAKHLGINQHDMIGNSIIDYIHKDDHNQLKKQFQVKIPGRQTFKGYGLVDDDAPTSMSVNLVDEDAANDNEENNSLKDYVQERQFFLRMRSVHSRRGTSNKGKVVGYRVVQFSGRLKLKCSSNSKGYSVEGLICLCRPILPQPVVEMRMDGNMFMSRHGMDMSFTFCDDRIITLIGYEPQELIGKTAYQFHNPLDANKVSDCHAKLIVKGSSSTKHYRFLGKNGDWVWMQTKATIIYNTNNEAQYVVCMNYVIGQEEGEKFLMLERLQHNETVIGNGVSSPGSDMMEMARVTSSPDIIEVPESSTTMCDAEIAKLIPQPVLDNAVIKKPYCPPPTLNIAALLKQEVTDDCPIEMDVGIEKSSPASFNTFPAQQSTSAAGPVVNTNTKPIIVNKPSVVGQVESNKINCPVLKEEAIWPVEQLGSPMHSEHSSEGSSNESPHGSPETQTHQSSKSTTMLSIAEEDSVFNDLMEITMEDLQSSESPDIPGNLPAGVSFNLNSPDNLSQLMSPGITMESVDSPLQYDDLFDKANVCKVPGILEKLLTSCPQNCDTNTDTNTALEDAMKMKFPPNSGQSNFMNVTFTKINRPQSSSLPEDIANFTLEYNIENIMDNSAADAMISAGIFDLTKPADNEGVIITEPTDHDLSTGTQLPQESCDKSRGYVNGQTTNDALSDSLDYLREQNQLAASPEGSVHSLPSYMNSQRINVSPQGINVTPQGLNVTPQGLNVTPQRLNVSPQGINVTPQGINVTPQRVKHASQELNVNTQGLNVTPSETNGTQGINGVNVTPQRVNGAQQRMNAPQNHNVGHMLHQVPTAHVTDRISKLDIKDQSSPTSVAGQLDSESKQSSILHSLLTRPGCSGNVQGAHGGDFNILSNGNVVQGPVMMNNNMEDQQLLEQFQKHQKSLEEEQERQRLLLIQKHEQQKLDLQEKHLETFLRRQQMQREDFEQTRTHMFQPQQQPMMVSPVARDQQQQPVQFNHQPPAVPLVPEEEMRKILSGPQMKSNPMNHMPQQRVVQTNGVRKQISNNMLYHGQVPHEKQVNLSNLQPMAFTQPQTSQMMNMSQNQPMYIQQQQQQQPAIYNIVKDSNQFQQYDGQTSLPSRLPPPYTLQNHKQHSLLLQQQQMPNIRQPNEILHMNQVINVVDSTDCDLFAANHAANSCILQQFN